MVVDVLMVVGYNIIHLQGDSNGGYDCDGEYDIFDVFIDIFYQLF